mmetsp:Transcript_14493/g.21860  ORF Transcript_14493/g.21860 Transcript_14493/m.21860 type:complete len:849 (-) Transcript_14493:349-2895(-)
MSSVPAMGSAVAALPPLPAAFVGCTVLEPAVPTAGCRGVFLYPWSFTPPATDGVVPTLLVTKQSPLFSVLKVLCVSVDDQFAMVTVRSASAAFAGILGVDATAGAAVLAEHIFSESVLLRAAKALFDRNCVCSKTSIITIDDPEPLVSVAANDLLAIPLAQRAPNAVYLLQFTLAELAGGTGNKLTLLAEVLLMLPDMFQPSSGRDNVAKGMWDILQSNVRASLRSVVIGNRDHALWRMYLVNFLRETAWPLELQTYNIYQKFDLVANNKIWTDRASFALNSDTTASSSIVLQYYDFDKYAPNLASLIEVKGLLREKKYHISSVASALGIKMDEEVTLSAISSIEAKLVTKVSVLTATTPSGRREQLIDYLTSSAEVSRLQVRTDVGAGSENAPVRLVTPNNNKATLVNFLALPGTADFINRVVSKQSRPIELIQELMRMLREEHKIFVLSLLTVNDLPTRDQNILAAINAIRSAMLSMSEYVRLVWGTVYAQRITEAPQLLAGFVPSRNTFGFLQNASFIDSAKSKTIFDYFLEDHCKVRACLKLSGDQNPSLTNASTLQLLFEPFAIVAQGLGFNEQEPPISSMSPDSQVAPIRTMSGLVRAVYHYITDAPTHVRATDLEDQVRNLFYTAAEEAVRELNSKRMVGPGTSYANYFLPENSQIPLIIRKGRRNFALVRECSHLLEFAAVSTTSSKRASTGDSAPSGDPSGSKKKQKTQQQDGQVDVQAIWKECVAKLPAALKSTFADLHPGSMLEDNGQYFIRAHIDLSTKKIRKKMFVKAAIAQAEGKSVNDICWRVITHGNKDPRKRARSCRSNHTLTDPSHMLSEATSKRLQQLDPALIRFESVE